MAHLPSGSFKANAGWLVPAAVAFNLTGAVGVPVGGNHGKASFAGFGTFTRFAVDGTRSYGADLTRQLTSTGVPMFGRLRPTRQVRRMRGKSDGSDTYTAAETALAGTNCSTPKDRNGHAAAARVVSAARRLAVTGRQDAADPDILVTAPDVIPIGVPCSA